ncbi:MAG: hypothetical protein V9E81_03835 [Marmoricola sp.]
MSEQPVGVDAAKRVVAALDFDRLTADVIELVKIPSVSGTPGEVRVQEWYSKALAEAGLTVDQWDLDLAGLAAHLTSLGWRCTESGRLAAWAPPVKARQV